MILLRANAELKVVFVKLINTMGKNFKWNEVFIIRNNNLVLTGSDSVLMFDFGNRAVGSNTAEVNLKEDSIIQITKNELLGNVLNMTLYAFGKWGKIKGLTVERDYPQINSLFGNILKEIAVEPVLTEESLRLYRDGVQITYEDMVQLILDRQKKEDREAEQQADENPSEEAGKEKGKYDIGLWHKIVWKGERYTFENEELTEEEKIKSRIGNNFYKVGYQCPICSKKLSMVIYPEGEELLIETDEKGVYLARAYTCHTCHRLFTPKPHLLLADGSVYTLDFEDDKEAYEDYIEIIGKTGVRSYNCNFNEYEADYRKDKIENQTPLEDVCKRLNKLSDLEVDRLKEKMDSGFYPPKSAVKFNKAVLKEIKKRKRHSKAAKEEEDSAFRLTRFSEQEADHSGKPGVVRSRSGRGRDMVRNHIPKLRGSMIGNKKEYDSESIQGNSSQKDLPHSSEYTSEKTSKKDSGINLSHTSGSNSRQSFRNKLYDTSKHTSNDDFNHFSDYDRNQEAVTSESAASSKPTGVASEARSDRSEPVRFLSKESSLREKAEACRGKDYRNVIRTMEEIKKEDLKEKFREELLQPLAKLLEEKGRKELEAIRLKIPADITKKQYLMLKDTIRQYKDIDHSTYLTYLDHIREEAEKQEITVFIKKAGARDRKSFMQLYQNLKKEDFEERIAAPFLETIHDKIYAMDEATIKKLCGDPAELSFEDGIRAYKEISDSELLPELKTNILGIIDQRLTKIKMNECEQLIGKLAKDMGKIITEKGRVHYYNVRKGSRTDQESEESLIIQNALNTYAAGRGKYEFPILICDASMKENGRRGFVLTPDHIFYNTLTESGTLDVLDIEELIARKGKNVCAVSERQGRIKLSNDLNLSDVKAFCKGLDEFITYLKEKPESRDVAYIAKEKHSVKCCYRCGHIYRGDNVCPKCGAKFNE